MPIKKYGSWESPISAEQVFDGKSNINFLRTSSKGLYFIANQKGAADQYQLMLLDPQNTVSAITPPEFNLRSTVHEYGAIPYAFSDSAIYFVNFQDQRLYQQRHGEIPKALTPDTNKELRFADFIVDEKNARLIAIREDHRNSQGASSKVKNTLVSIGLDTGGEGDILYAESDFVSSPKLSVDGRYLCWQIWQHPNMPWDDTLLLLAEIDGNGELFNPKTIAKKIGGSLVQPLFNRQGDLYFISDWSNWWNLYRLEKRCFDEAYQADRNSSIKNTLGDNSQRVIAKEADFTGPQWTLGQRNYALVDDKQVLLSYSENGLWYLGLLNLDTQGFEKFSGVYGEIANVVAKEGIAYFSATTAASLISIYKIDLNEQGHKKLEQIYDPMRSTGKAEWQLPKTMVSTGEAFSFLSENGGQSYGFFYPPKNANVRAPENDLPPLIIGIHGGPTSASTSALNLNTQYWTSRGFAVAEINHRGSTGFGRAYRQSLYRHWGVYDLEDTIAGVNYLINQGRVDPNKLAIHGGSAGGYTVMAMLAFYDLFKVGVSYYGISDLEALAGETHKFESRYLDQLIGPYPEAQEAYQQRSPINHVGNITASLLILQGLEDKVVPPGQAKKIYEEINGKLECCEFICFEDEGHGFRKKKNQVYALEQELGFYRKVMSL